MIFQGAGKMQYDTLHTTATQRVIARLYSEGWEDCPELKFPALRQHSLPELRGFILAQLEDAGGWMDKVDLELAALIFSIPGHKFEVHPHLHLTLNRLKEEGLIEFQRAQKLSPTGYKTKTTIALTSAHPLNMDKVAV